MAHLQIVSESVFFLETAISPAAKHTESAAELPRPDPIGIWPSKIY